MSLEYNNLVHTGRLVSIDKVYDPPTWVSKWWLNNGMHFAANPKRHPLQVIPGILLSNPHIFLKKAYWSTEERGWQMGWERSEPKKVEIDLKKNSNNEEDSSYQKSTCERDSCSNVKDTVSSCRLFTYKHAGGLSMTYRYKYEWFFHLGL